MSELSPSAKIILAASAKANCLQEWDHVDDPPCHPDDSDWNGCYTCVHRAGIAAALRAAADQLYDSASQDYLWKLAAELEHTND
jgi:hypothetical protein